MTLEDWNVTVYSGSPTEEGDPPSTQALGLYIVTGVFAVIFIVGLLGNGTLVYIIIRHKSMRTIPNIFILNLAIGDLLVILTCIPFTALRKILQPWPWGEAICKVSQGIPSVAIGVTVFTLTALSVERYLIIVKPIQSYTSSKRLTIVMVFAIWVVSLTLAVPSAAMLTVKYVYLSDDVTLAFCTINPDLFTDSYEYMKGMVMFQFLAYYVIPFLFIAVLYILMARQLTLSTRSLPEEHGRRQRSQIQARMKVAKTVLAFVVIFIICFIPQHMFKLWLYFNPNSIGEYNLFWKIFSVSAFYLTYIHSCINPIALYICSESFRVYFNHYLLCRQERCSMII